MEAAVELTFSVVECGEFLDDLAVTRRPLAERRRRDGVAVDVDVSNVLDVVTAAGAVDDERVSVVPTVPGIIAARAATATGER
jgi:hypothetical protein